MVPAEEAIEKAKQVLSSMGHSMHLIEEVVPGEEGGRSVWLVTALTFASGRLVVVINRVNGEVLAVRRVAREERAST